LGKRQEQQHDRDMFGSAMVCCLLANINRDPKKSQPFKLEDFMPKRDVKPRRTNITPSAPRDTLYLRDMARSLNKCFGGTERPVKG
jgi:hypothetical protein